MMNEYKPRPDWLVEVEQLAAEDWQGYDQDTATAPPYSCEYLKSRLGQAIASQKLADMYRNLWLSGKSPVQLDQMAGFQEAQK